MKSPLLTIALPVGSNPRAERAAFAAIAAHHGYLTNYHTATEHGSPGLFILAINGGEVVTAPFEPEWYNQALAALAPFVVARESWAELLSASIRAAQERAAEYDE